MKHYKFCETCKTVIDIETDTHLQARYSDLDTIARKWNGDVLKVKTYPVYFCSEGCCQTFRYKDVYTKVYNVHRLF